MLVLTRKQAESIQIGDNIKIKVIRTGKGSVKIGIDAPKSIRVMRAELTSDEQEGDTEAIGELKFEDTAKLPAAVSHAGYVTLPQAV
ncbi:carbon storage regulator CsrA [Calycomorphotria hydatis]|uniref:Translational regulator CsrA n=1 Tax=Calycomorphotria hydatis TaxID=2528027 RepID=A0A517TAL1_9PLAN|nr:carbon storage regulator CsrA [Calycomorphotria hydatis]QDT65411.1 hypothetical protein V22_26640 [Calycomorphotria hydatis]